ncbi:MAG: HlyD family efflux transporter periplasmic adaptor subunit, partial [Planctomycetaceae bacterium]|nr:HlyD family efflux transporter periplasmic adaptor subunit [Planctomycetaceae bacterium]
MAKPRKSRVGQWLRRAGVFAVGLGVVGMIVYALLPKPVPVDLGAVERGLLQVTVDEDGRTRIKDQYVVSTPLSGRLLRIGLDVGDAVVAGETVIARIQPTDPDLLDPRARAQSEARVKAAEARLNQTASGLERAQATMDFAESELARIRKLRERNSATPSQLEEKEMQFRTSSQEFRAAKFAEEIARFELELERAALMRTQSDDQEGDGAGRNESGGTNGEFVIHAPISGRVLKLFQQSATVVTPGMQLLQLGDPADLEVVVDVLSSDAVRIQPGAHALLDQWGGDVPLSATVRLVEPSGFTKISALGVEEQRVNVILDFDDPPEKRAALGDSFRVEAHVIVWEGPQVLKVPNSALFRHERQWAVFRVDDSRAHLQPVEVGRQNSLESEIVAGLNEDDRIVMHPSDQV